MKHLLTCISIAGLSAGCAPMQADVVADRPVDAMPTDAMGYVAMAGSSDLYEIESSRLALQRATSPAVRQFAQMMIDHHMMTTQQLTQAARSAGMAPPPPMLMPPQRMMMDELQRTSGTEFDRVYLQQQRIAHGMAKALHGSYAKRGDTAQLRGTAAAAVPVVQRHIDRLRTLGRG